ncbi:MAG: T9SS type A sorting domain-containing protein, partial [Bacteroidota bacterium]
MKRLTLLLLSTLFTMMSVQAQITIGTADLPSAGRNYLMSIANPLTGANYALTGAGQVWDFSQLTAQSQRTDSFLSINATSAVFSVVFFNSSFNPNRANVATGGADFNLGTTAVNDVYNFFYNSSSAYTQVGFGATIGGIPAPFTYNPKDVVYSFPLQFGDIDTSFSSYNVDLSSTLGLYFRVNRTRVNNVDGWGTLITPYGTHDVLRVKTTIVERDSVHIDSLNFGLNLPPVTTIEYKWMASGEGVPLLQANANAGGTVNQVVYRDSTVLNTGIAQTESNPFSLVVYPNPASDFIHVDGSGVAGAMTYSVIDFQGRVVLSNEINAGSQTKTSFDVALNDLAPGNYLLQVSGSRGVTVRAFSKR